MKKIEILKLSDNELDKAIKIQGTQYDRKRKISSSTIKKMNRMVKAGKSVSEISNKIGISYLMVKYHTDPVFKSFYNSNRSGKHCGKDHITVMNRVKYKRSLVASGKVSA